MLITGGGRQDQIDEAFRLGIYSCLMKPFTMTNVADIIEVFTRQEAA